MQQRNGDQEAQDPVQMETEPSTSQPHLYGSHHGVLIAIFWNIKGLIVLITLIISFDM